MDREQLDALPDELRAIVAYDRELAQIRATSVPSLERFRAAKEIRADWRKSAIARWGGAVRGDGPGRRA